MSSPTKTQSNAVIRLAHLLFIFSIVPLLFTGLRIAVANEPALIRLAMLLPQGDVHTWHFRSALLLAFAIGLYIMGRIKRRRLPNLKHPSISMMAFNITHYLAWALLTVSLTTGVQLILGWHFLPVEWTLRLHLISAISMAVYFIVHSAVAFIALPWRQVLKAFVISGQRITWAWLILLGMTVLVTFSAWLMTQPKTLKVGMTDQSIELDGDLREAAWAQANTVRVQTYQGYRQPTQGTLVTIKALRDNKNIYFYISWPDSTRSQMHVPLIKTEEGWKVVQTDLKQANENTFYEDKLAVMFTQSSSLAGGGTVQLGEQPLKDQPAPPSKRGLHYTTNGQIADVWHWKSVRTGLSLGQADDNYFGPPSPSDSEYKRYTGGYQKDRDDCEHLVRWDGSDFQTKPECGGYVMNWTLYDDGIITPLRLPANKALLKRLGQANFDANESDFGSWWLDWEDTIAYHPDEDNYPLNTIIPSVLSLGPFSQGRGDVEAVGYWRDGLWQVELKRALDTGSEFDLEITNESYLWVSTFDHSQTRHSYHIKPVRLELN
ncbi:ethylbenzene dehydrogenase-related protein [Reinekea marina]|uniref:Ethylbenzene dehydrogenase-related protein n=1 Tax=Reinekea marina TaxID=1310421 RepID=A0ABV7WPX3_9GAMM|nr:ethylbenzene dehydrogenase-related protein [Reinekea marina]MDN3650402.1 ethylbenzene dehydrogenase-related protein [Reinekea marina]